MSSNKSLTRRNVGTGLEPLEDRRMLAAFELSSLLAENGGGGSAGFVARGEDVVFAIGDFNGDGFDDFFHANAQADLFKQSGDTGPGVYADVTSIVAGTAVSRRHL